MDAPEAKQEVEQIQEHTTRSTTTTTDAIIPNADKTQNTWDSKTEGITDTKIQHQLKNQFDLATLITSENKAIVKK